jgi:hypothetical protein
MKLLLPNRLAPTLARHVDPDEHAAQSRRDVQCWAQQNLRLDLSEAAKSIELTRPTHTHAEIVATLLYPVTKRRSQRSTIWRRAGMTRGETK